MGYREFAEDLSSRLEVQIEVKVQTRIRAMPDDEIGTKHASGFS